MENSFETKEETVAFLHEMLEWLSPAKEKIESTSCREFTLGETIAIAGVMNALEELDEALCELDRVVQV